jgi:hypothetical protein
MVLLLIPTVLADYCYDIDIKPIDNVTGKCYLVNNTICISSNDAREDTLCTINYVRYTDTLNIDQQRMLGIISRNLTNITTEIVMDVQSSVKVKYIDRNITEVKYINNTIIKEVMVEKPVEVIKYINQTQYVKANGNYILGNAIAAILALVIGVLAILLNRHYGWIEL